MDRRDFLHVLALATAAGFPLLQTARNAAAAAAAPYDVPAFGNVHLLHLTDCHAQLLPVWFREPSVNLGVGYLRGRPPHVVGRSLLREFGVAAGSAQAHALTHIDFVRAAKKIGRAHV